MASAGDRQKGFASNDKAIIAVQQPTSAMRNREMPILMLSVLPCICHTAVAVELKHSRTRLPHIIIPLEASGNFDLHGDHQRDHLLALRGGATKEEESAAAISFALTNAAVYAVLYGAMVTLGGITFISLACLGVWALWLVCLNKRIVDEVLARPKETFLGLASYFLNVTSGDSDEEDLFATEARRLITSGFLQEGDVYEQHAERGQPITIPSEMLLLDCDNGLDWIRLREGDSVTQLLEGRSELITFELISEMTYIKRKQHYNSRGDSGEMCDAKDATAISSMFRDGDYDLVSFRRGEPFFLPSDRLLVRCDNGLGDDALGENGLDAINSIGQLKQRSENVTLSFVRERTFRRRWLEYEAGPRSDAPLHRASAAFFKRFEGIMEGNFLAPSAWRKLRSRPLACFGSVFSHMNLDHISANLGALRMCRRLGWARHDLRIST